MAAGFCKPILQSQRQMKVVILEGHHTHMPRTRDHPEKVQDEQFLFLSKRGEGEVERKVWKRSEESKRKKRSLWSKARGDLKEKCKTVRKKKKKNEAIHRKIVEAVFFHFSFRVNDARKFFCFSLSRLLLHLGLKLRFCCLFLCQEIGLFMERSIIHACYEWTHSFLNLEILRCGFLNWYGANLWTSKRSFWLEGEPFLLSRLLKSPFILQLRKIVCV